VIVLLVFVVLALLAVFLARRFRPLSPAQCWALAASGNLGAFQNGDLVGWDMERRTPLV
jgi:hypothetical protein